MVQASMFWDAEVVAGEPDRLYTSEDFAQLFNKILTDGYLVGFADEFDLTDAGANMKFNVGTGAAWIQGRVFEVRGDPVELTFDPGDPANPRIDLIVIRSDYAARTVSLAVKEGVPAGAPVAPALTRVPGVTWELGLYSVLIPANDLDLSLAQVTDLREDPAWCGGVEIMGFPPHIESLLDVDASSIMTGDTLVWDGSKFVPSLLQDPAVDTVQDLLRSLAEVNVAIWELEAKSLAQDNGLQDWHGDGFVKTMNRIESRTNDANGLPRLGIYRHEDRDQGFIGIDDIDPVEYQEAVAMGYGAQFMAIHPSGNWVALSSSSDQVYIFPAVDGIPTGAASVSNKTGIGSDVNALEFSRDGKVLVASINSTPFLKLYPFTVETGALGNAAADPATLLPSNTTGKLSFTPNDNYFICTTSSSPYVHAYAIDTDAGTWGAKSANPAALPSSTVYDHALSPAGDFIYLVGNLAPGLAAYAFNQGTGAFGARAGDPGGANTNMRAVVVSPDGTKIIVAGSTAPYLWGYNWNAGAFSAVWAAPGTTLYADGHTGNGMSQTWHLQMDPWHGEWIAVARSITTSGTFARPNIVAYKLNANSWGAQTISPAINVSGWDNNAYMRVVKHKYGSVIFPFNNSVTMAIDRMGTKELTGQAVTTTKVLDTNASQVYILDDPVLDAGVTRQYDVSTDGGGAWQNNVPVGQVVNVPPGNQLKVRVTMTRAALGQEGRIYWFLAWGG